jgi:hypothetical protein
MLQRYVVACCWRQLLLQSRDRRDATQARYDAATVADVQQFMSVLYMFLPIPIFWALFDQQSSRWVPPLTTTPLLSIKHCDCTGVSGGTHGRQGRLLRDQS